MPLAVVWSDGKSCPVSQGKARRRCTSTWAIRHPGKKDWSSDSPLLNGSSWVGNFQQSNHLSPIEVLLWSEANSIIVTASGALYLINAANPAEYQSIKHVNNILFDEARDTLFVAGGIRVRALDRSGQVRWIRQNLGGSHVELIGCREGVLSVELEMEMGEPRRTVRIRVGDGRTIS